MTAGKRKQSQCHLALLTSALLVQQKVDALLLHKDRARNILHNKDMRLSARGMKNYSIDIIVSSDVFILAGPDEARAHARLPPPETQLRLPNVWYFASTPWCFFFRDPAGCSLAVYMLLLYVPEHYFDIHPQNLCQPAFMNVFCVKVNRTHARAARRALTGIEIAPGSMTADLSTFPIIELHSFSFGPGAPPVEAISPTITTGK